MATDELGTTWVEGPAAAGQAPAPEVVAVARPRHFSAEYKRRILEEADRCTRPGGSAESRALGKEGCSLEPPPR